MSILLYDNDHFRATVTLPFLLLFFVSMIITWTVTISFQSLQVESRYIEECPDEEVCVHAHASFERGSLQHFRFFFTLLVMVGGYRS